VSTKYKSVNAVEVFVWGKKVGAVALDPRTKYYAFEYEPKFVKGGLELAPLQMPLTNAGYPFLFVNLPQETYYRLPAMLADALPDKFGNALINAWMAEKGVSADMVSPLDRLAYMGERAMGALTFKPARGPSVVNPTPVDMGLLVKQARSVIKGELTDDAHTLAVLRQIIQVGTSAGGARAKATIAWNRATNSVLTGQYVIPDGYEAWLLKFDGLGEDEQLGVGQDFGRIEYAYYLMAKEAGIEMSECRLLEEGGRAHFMTKRFDRDGQQRHHMQSLCAMANLDFNAIGVHSYSQLFQVVDQLDLGHDARLEVLRRMVFNIVAANHDDHTKNFGFLLKQGGKWALTPAYDLTFAYNPKNKWIRQHLMVVNGKSTNILLEDIQVVADMFKLSGYVKPVIKQIQQAVGLWSHFAAEAGVSSAESHRIATLLPQFKLL
jgi:serine/threonine-protein kinase HipA